MAGTYPPLLADINNDIGRFDPFHLFITAPEYGEQGQAADGQAISQFQILAMDTDGRLVPWDDAGGHASVVGTFTGQPSNNDTITLNGVAITFVNTLTTGAQVLIGATDVATAANLVALVNGVPDSTNDLTSMPVYGTEPLANTGVRASLDSTGLVVTFTAVQGGTAGNAIPVAESATNFAFSGSATSLAGAEADRATGSLNFTGIPANADTLTIDGNVITFVNGAAGAHQVTRDGGATATDVATATAAEINANPGLYGVVADRSGVFIGLTAIEEGLGGNAVTLAHSATEPVLSGATLTGGGVSEPDEAGMRPIGIAAQPVAAATPGAMLPYWRDGVFNHSALVWPAGVATLAQRKRAFAGSPIGVGQLL